MPAYWTVLAVLLYLPTAIRGVLVQLAVLLAGLAYIVLVVWLSGLLARRWRA